MAKRCNKNRSIRRYILHLEKAARLKAKIISRAVREGRMTAPKPRWKVRLFHLEGCPAIITLQEVDCDCPKEEDLLNDE